MKERHKYTLLIIVVGLVTYIGFGPLFELTQSDLAKHFLSAAFGAIFISFITLFLMQSQSENEENKEKKTIIFEKKLQVFDEFYKKLEELVEKGLDSEGGKLEHKDINNLIFRLSNIRKHCSIDTVEDLNKSIKKLFGDSKESPMFDNPKALIEELFNIVDVINVELFGNDKRTDSGIETQIAGYFEELLLNEEYSSSINKDASQEINKEKIDNIKKTLEGKNGKTGHWFANTKERNWEWLVENSFWEGGIAKSIVSQLKKWKKGDYVYAYLSGEGYIGYGVVVGDPIKGREIKENEINGVKLPQEAQDKINETLADEDLDEEYFFPVEWTKKSRDNSNLKSSLPLGYESSKGIINHYGIQTVHNMLNSAKGILTADAIRKEFND